MSWYSRLAIATRGFRGGAGQTLYVSQSFTLEEDPDASLASIITTTVDTATIVSAPLEITISDPTAISVSVIDSPITVDIATDSIAVTL